MKDTTLLRIALITSMAGLAGLLVALHTTDLNVTALTALDNAEMEKTVKVRGVLEKVTVTEKATFLEVVSKESVTAVIFEPVALEEGSFVEIVGTVDEYRGEREILVEQIKG